MEAFPKLLFRHSRPAVGGGNPFHFEDWDETLCFSRGRGGEGGGEEETKVLQGTDQPVHNGREFGSVPSKFHPFATHRLSLPSSSHYSRARQGSAKLPIT